MKKTIATFVLGGFITAGAFGLAYELPISSAAEKTTPAMMQMDPNATADMMKQCTEMMKNPEMQKMMQSVMPGADSKAADPKAVEDMTKQCTEMMKNPEMHKMMQTMMLEGDSTAADPKATAAMMKQCAEMMKNPEMQTMMNSAQTNPSPADETNHSAHHQ
ncbi:MAG: Spore germination GerD central core domain [Anaerosporomusa subterranea]|nr:Spore germination GerD central core domain [Anaerosporomusa subterranea]